MKRFLVCPGYVHSRNDGDRHWISADRLIDLYGVDPRECVIANRGLTWADEKSLIRLTPRYSGHYREHLENLIKDREAKIA